MAPGDGTRGELIRAGWELTDELALERIFGITTSGVAARAGVTTGSFFHHFRNMSDYAAALVHAMIDEDRTTPEEASDLAAAVRSGQIAASLSELLTMTWKRVGTDPQRQAERRRQMLLFAHLRATLPDGETVGDLLRSTFRAQVDRTSTVWQAVLDLTEMRLDPPFDTARLAVVVQALLLGMELVHGMDPDAVDDTLFADATATLAGAVSRLDLRVPRVLVAEELGQEHDASPQARSGARRREETRNRIVERSSGMFDDGWDHISASDVAEVSGVSTQTVLNLFGNVRTVCAATFVRHLPAFEAAIAEGMPDRPADATRDALVELARSASADPHPARAFLAERLGVRTSRSFDLSDDDIRVLAPFGLRLVYVVAELGGRDVGDPEVADVTAALVDAVLAHATPRPGRSEESAAAALRVLPPGFVATATESGRQERPN